MATRRPNDHPFGPAGFPMGSDQPSARAFRMIIDLNRLDSHIIDRQIDELVHRSTMDYEEKLRNNLRERVREVIADNRSGQRHIELEFKVNQDMRTHRREAHTLSRESNRSLQDSLADQRSSFEQEEYARRIRQPIIPPGHRSSGPDWPFT